MAIPFNIWLILVNFDLTNYNRFDGWPTYYLKAISGQAVRGFVVYL